ncbi:MAG: MBL fold metallo-hydrolase [Galactobacillus timonensis]|jgi:hydroxyacylglutathione hydrolase|uniref:MBL fold metallo-hydrolase n=1 Tax=Galactobacillus timonensis TaxID=2041840 RepID=UPI00240962A1|nr:MBL fold metallo-hydrolase [Galactobacillus timonensis]MDD5851743.1 MBL fold metallo-hydrolase [Galactobacillus timonensis]MDD6370014.1 MBL fold metallo-hydrolase [Galactobacillus timonensis]MDD6600039.1 MBL fold metallo-hydrolase [Galactobacillus timonensis]MDD6680915.1 MBL fold metallo-hydrolase [Galactobacillus timonensis]
MRIDTLPIGLYEENSYVVHDHGHVLFIDPGRYWKQIASRVEDDETVDAILLTHGHADHTGAVDDLADRYQCPVYLNSGDWELVDPHHTSQGYESPVYHELQPLEEGSCTIGTFPLTVYATPGHTKGSVLIRYRNVIFTGDTLFASDVGRTDLFGGSEEELQASLLKILLLPSDLLVYPGHGPSSSMAVEKQTNPYLVFSSGR